MFTHHKIATLSNNPFLWTYPRVKYYMANIYALETQIIDKNLKTNPEILVELNLI
jgi:hypothetical protein